MYNSSKYTKIGGNRELKLLSQNRIVIPQDLIQDMVPLPEDGVFKIFFSEHLRCVVFSSQEKKGSIVQIGRIRFDSKKRMMFSSRLYELIPKLLNGEWEEFYFCLNQKKELCIKKAP